MYVVALLSLLPLSSGVESGNFGPEMPGFSGSLESPLRASDEDDKTYSSLWQGATDEWQSIKGEMAVPAFSYDYSEVKYVSVGGLDGERAISGLALEYNRSFQENFFLNASLAFFPEQDANATAKYPRIIQPYVGGGVHYSITSSTDVVAQAGFGATVIDGFENLTGFGGEVGIRQRLSESLQVKVAMERINIDDNVYDYFPEEATSFEVLFGSRNNINFCASFRDTELTDQISFGVRFLF